MKEKQEIGINKDERNNCEIKVNLKGISASLEFEDFTITDEMLAYAEKRLSNEMSYQDRLNEIKAKYKDVPK